MFRFKIKFMNFLSNRGKLVKKNLKMLKMTLNIFKKSQKV